jgi:hypothetical protein
MKKWIAFFLLGLAAAGAQTTTRGSHPQPTKESTVQACHCPEVQMLFANQQQESAELARTIAGLRARMTMLRNDAGIINNQQLRDALQVDADMWESMVELMQSRAERLQRGIPQQTAPSASPR